MVATALNDRMVEALRCLRDYMQNPRPHLHEHGWVHNGVVSRWLWEKGLGKRDARSGTNVMQALCRRGLVKEDLGSSVRGYSEYRITPEGLTRLAEIEARV